MKIAGLKQIIGWALAIVTFMWLPETCQASLIGLWCSDTNQVSDGSGNTNTTPFYETVEFLNDGSFKITDYMKAMNGNQLAIPIKSGKYTLIDTNHVRLEVSNGRFPLEVPFSISGDRLEMLALVPSAVMETTKYRRMNKAEAYSESMFRQALANHSTAPDYVLVEVRGADDEAYRTVCTTANLFSGAIHREYGLGYTESDEKQANAIAVNQPDRLFTFHKKEAIHNLADYETPEVLADVRQQFAGKKDTELLNGGFINSVVNKAPRSKHSAYRDAVAHALLERGIGCKMGDIDDELFSSSVSCQKSYSNIPHAVEPPCQ